MNRVTRLGLLVVAVTATGCLYPSLKTVTGTGGTAGGITAASGSGGVGIGGVLEPVQAAPVIIEDNCFIGFNLN